MSFFGIPIIIPYEYYTNFIIENFPTYTTFVGSNVGLVLYFILNFMYLMMVYTLIKFVYKIIIWLKNSLFR